MKPKISPARVYALNVLHDVLTNGELLDEALEQSLPVEIADNDRALARETASGTCRQLGKIRYTLKQFANRFEHFPPLLQRILELSTYQLLFLSRVPDFAVVSDAVNLANQKKMKGLSKAVNGILRNLSRQKDALSYPGKDEDFIQYLTVEYSHPSWLLQKWQSLWDDAEIEELCRFNNTRASLSLRIRGDMDAAKQILSDLNIQFRDHEVLSNILLIHADSQVDPSLYQNKHWVVQDSIMTLPARIMNPQPGWKIWDVCAAPGGKTFHLADYMNGTGTIFATDRSAHRLEKLHDLMRFLGYENIQPLALNPLHDTLPQEISGIDAILLDVPCTGWGTFRRNPDLRWRLKQGDSKQLSEITLQLLAKTVAQLKPGGIVVYSTCTLSPDENEKVIQRFLEENHSFQLKDIHSYIPLEWQSGIRSGCFTAFPPITNTDGAFCARLQKTG